MQQKFLWGGAALIVLGAAATYFGVDYAFHNPASMLARFGVAATFGGLNPNPLSDLSQAVFGGPAVQHPRGQVIEANITTPGKTDADISADSPAEETIEPIQVESLPPATVEPPTGVEESEWTGPWQAMFERFTGDPVEQAPKPDSSDLIVPVEQAPRPMPYADEDVSDETRPDDTSAVMNVLRALSKLCCGLASTGGWEAAEEFVFSGGCGGCLSWFEYCVPEQIPVMPNEMDQQPATDQCEHGCQGQCHHGYRQRCGSPCWPPRSQEGQEDSNQPSHLTPDHVDGGIAPRTPGLDKQEETKELQEPSCHRGCHHTFRPSTPVVSGLTPAGTLTPDLGVPINTSSWPTSSETRKACGEDLDCQNQAANGEADKARNAK